MDNDLLYRELGPLLPLLRDDRVTDITVAATGRIRADTLDGPRDLPETLDRRSVESLIATLAGLEGQVAHEGHPVLEVMFELPDGLRVRTEAILPPVSPAPILCLRRPASHLWTLDELVERDSLAAQARDLLELALHDGKTIVIAGSTGSGKTTLASALLSAAAPQRLAVCEDGVRELRLANSVQADRLLTAPQAGVTMADLVRAALRLNPDRVVIGEVRGPEALDVLRAAITGHPGLCTLHAASPAHALPRLRDLAEEAGVQLSLHRVQQAVDLVAYMARRGHRRVLTALYEPDPVEGHVDLRGRYLYQAVGTRRLHQPSEHP